MLPVFEAAGFDSILFMRDPIDLWVSWSVALSTELAHCWPADMQMPDRRYNYAVAPSFWPSKAQWLKAREQHENRVEGAWRRDKLLNRCRGLLELIQQELVKRGKTIKELRRRHRICAR